MFIPKGLYPHCLSSVTLSLSLFLFLLSVQRADNCLNRWLIEREWLSIAIIFNMLPGSYNLHEFAVTRKAKTVLTSYYMLYNYSFCTTDHT